MARMITADDLRRARRLVDQIILDRPGTRHMRDDLVSAAYEGLAKAAKRYQPSIGATFESFSRHRIRGAVMDYLRLGDPVSRHTRILAKQRGTEPPSIRVLYGETAEKILDNIAVEAQEDGADLEGLRARLVAAAECLTPRERVVMSLMLEGLTGVEVSRVFQLTESRISQIWGAALRKLRSKLGPS